MFWLNSLQFLSYENRHAESLYIDVLKNMRQNNIVCNKTKN